MIGNGVKLTKILGIEIWVDYSWLVIFALVTWSLAGGFFPKEYPGLTSLAYWIMGAFAAILLFLCVLLHELSHSYVAQKSGIAVPRITLFIFGGVAQIAEDPKNPKIELNVAVAGPICSLLLALLFWILSKSVLVSSYIQLLAIFEYLAFINIALAVFNLVPGFPLDGGRILRAYLWDRWGDMRKATHTVSRIGSGFGIGLIILGLINFFLGNFIGGIWLVFIGMFLNQASKSGYRMTLAKDALTGVKVRDIMTSKVTSVPASISLNELVNKYFHQFIFICFPVVNEEGELLGLVSLRQIKDVPKELWDQKTVGDIMMRNSDFNILSPDDDALRAVNLIMRNDLGRAPVVERRKLVGIITRRDIMTFLSIKYELGT
ncbi:MAG TPA: site-2 protease family protein [Thermodesulfobacteriota bacterium]|jgi:Zn-dependent protease/predicted transcriptional regulator